MDRRSFIAALSAAPFAARLEARPRLERPGVQLYTVRDAMAEDVDGTLATLAEIGYREVEMAGTYGMTPAAFRRSLDAAGLRAVSGHVDYPRQRGDVRRALDLLVGGVRMTEGDVLVDGPREQERLLEDDAEM